MTFRLEVIQKAKIYQELENERAGLYADILNTLGKFNTILEVGIGEATTFSNLLPRLSHKDFIAAERKAFEARVDQEVAKRLETVEAADTKETSEEVAEISKASENQEQDSSDEVEDALENVQVEDAAVINNNESSSEVSSSLRDRFAKTFKESVKISY